MWCAFKSIGAVKIKQPKDRALDRLHYYLQRELSGFPTENKYTMNRQNVKRYWSDNHLLEILNYSHFSLNLTFGQNIGQYSKTDVIASRKRPYCGVAISNLMIFHC